MQGGIEPKFLIAGKIRRIALVKSCRRFGARQHACRETWAGELSRNAVPLWFLEGGHRKQSIVECWIRLTCGDSYNDNSFKLRDALSLLLEHDPFDLVFICDDDTFVHWRRWLDFQPDSEFTGLATQEIPWVHGGGGWYMSRRACERYVAGIVKRCSWDDRLATEILGKEFTFDNRPDLFSQWPDQRVSADNSLITCHKVKPSEMSELFKSTYDLAPVYNALS